MLREFIRIHYVLDLTLRSLLQSRTYQRLRFYGLDDRSRPLTCRGSVVRIQISVDRAALSRRTPARRGVQTDSLYL